MLQEAARQFAHLLEIGKQEADAVSLEFGKDLPVGLVHPGGAIGLLERVAAESRIGPGEVLIEQALQVIGNGVARRQLPKFGQEQIAERRAAARAWDPRSSESAFPAAPG